MTIQTIPFLALVLMAPLDPITPKNDWREIEIVPLEIEKTVPASHVLANGIRLFLLEDDRIPLVDVSIMFRAGAVYEPPARAGLAELVGRTLRTGGTESLAPREVDRLLDGMAARLRTWVGEESGGAYLNVHSDHVERAIEILADILRRPRFDGEMIEIEKNKMGEEIRRQNDDPIRIAMRESSSILYGPDHNEGRYPTFESIDPLSPADLKTFHRRFFAPNEFWIGIAGNITSERALAIVEKRFGDWERKSVVYPPFAEPIRNDSIVIYHAQKETAQSTIMIGHLSIRESNPDRASLNMANFILGGSFTTSRLVTAIRHERGLAYWVGSFFSPRGLYEGTFSTVALTKGESTGQVTGLLLEEIRRIAEEEVSNEELETARSSLLNREAFEYESAEILVRRMVHLDYLGLPADYYEGLFRKYQSIDAPTILDATRRNIRPDAVQILVVGDESRFDVPLEDFGYEVRRIQLD